MTASLLVTNDFPPKVGGIQSYLYELWRRLPADETTVLTTPHPEAAAWDARQPFRIERTRAPVLLPTRAMARRVNALAAEVDAQVVFVDPMFPVGHIVARLDRPAVVVAHGAEISVYGRLPVTASLGRRTLRRAAGVVAAGQYAAQEAARVAGQTVPTLVIPPGVDADRFQPHDAATRRATRVRHGLDPDAPLVLGVSRLVPRKGFDLVLDAVAGLDGVHVAIVGTGRDEPRLARHARALGPRAHVLGAVPQTELPSLYACADVFAMLCRDRWGGVEAEGFGIVFLEAAACDVPSVAGRSGGSPEAVVDGETGFVVDPRDVDAARAAIDRLMRDEGRRRRLGAAAGERARADFSYDRLAARLAPLAAGSLDTLEVPT
ncbi:MAG TPA: glycosyltransferase family 4 protein [Acidimicrobiia bacterium]|nr:glycosyltransferase family 4 protein [Acidimicrobiia bacterium]